MERKTYWDDDFYQIVNYGDSKYIKVDGYFYDVGEAGFNDDGKIDQSLTSRCVDYCGVEMPLEVFLKMRESNEDFRSVITEIAAVNKQYISDITPEDAKELMHTYYSGKAPTELIYENITMDTPCGCYVDA